MADLAALFASLQSTQKAKTVVRLSERNVIELVNKLKQLGLLGDDLLHTITGREFITTQRLKQEVQLALKQVLQCVGVQLLAAGAGAGRQPWRRAVPSVPSRGGHHAGGSVRAAREDFPMGVEHGPGLFLSAGGRAAGSGGAAGATGRGPGALRAAGGGAGGRVGRRRGGGAGRANHHAGVWASAGGEGGHGVGWRK